MKISSINSHIYNNNKKIYSNKSDKPRFISERVSLPNFTLSKSGFYTSAVSFKGIDESVKLKALYSDTKIFSKYLAEKIAKQLGVTTPDDAHKIVNEVMNQSGCDEITAREVIARLVQFSNTQSLEVIEDALNEDNVSEIKNLDSNFSLSSTLSYINKTKEQIILTGQKKSAVFADEDLINISKFSHDSEESKEFYNLATDIFLKRTYIYLLDGFYGPSGEAYNMFAQSDDVKNIAVNVISEMKRTGKTFDEVLNKPMKTKIKKTYGRLVPIKIIQNPKVKNPTDKNIAEMMSPPLPSKEDIQAFIEYYSSYIKNTEKLKYPISDIKNFIAGYLDTMLTAYSPKALNNALKAKYLDIYYIVSKLGKTMDDVIYLVPICGEVKSFNTITKQFAIANNIDPEQVQEFSAFASTNDKEKSKFQDKVVVVLDDFAGSGESIAETKFDYWDFIKHFPDDNVIFAPIVLLYPGYKFITNVIQKFKRDNKDFILPTKFINHKLFDNGITDTNKAKELSNALGLGYSRTDSCSVFPFGVPDNNTNLAMIFSGFFLKDKIAPTEVHCDRQYEVEPDIMHKKIRKISESLKNK